MNIVVTILEDLFKHFLTALGTYLVLRFGVNPEHAGALVKLAPVLAGVASALIGIGLSVLHSSYLKWQAKVGPVGSVKVTSTDAKAGGISGAAMVGVGFILLGFSLASGMTGCAAQGANAGQAAPWLANLGAFTVSATENPTFQKAEQTGLTFAGKVVLSKAVAGQDRIDACNKMFAAADMFDSMMPKADGTSTPVTDAQVKKVAASWGIDLSDSNEWSDGVNFIVGGLDAIPGKTAQDITTQLGILSASARAAATAYATNVNN